MPGVIGPIIPIFASVTLMMLGSGALSTLIGIRLTTDGFSPVIVGAITAAYYGGLTLGSLQCFRLIIRVGHIRAFAAFASIFSAAVLGHALSSSIATWGVLRFIEGVCIAGIYMCVESWLNDHATNETRGGILSQYMVTLFTALAVSQQLINFDEPNGPFLFMIIAILLSLSLVPIALTRATAPVLPDVVALGLQKLIQASPLGIAGVFLSGTMTGALYGLGPVFAAQSGAGVSGAALFMTILIAGGVLLQWPLGRLSDVFDRRRVIIILSVTLSITSFFLATVPDQESFIFLALVLLFGGLLFSLYPMSMAHTNDHVAKEQMVAVSGGLILVNSIGAILGPLAAAWAMSISGPGGLFFYAAIIAGALGIFGFWRTFVRMPPLPDEQMAYRAMPQSTPVGVPLHPEMEEDATATS